MSISRLTEKRAQTLEKYAGIYSLDARQPGFLCHGDILVYMIAYPELIVFIHVMPYGYLTNMIIEGVEEEIVLSIVNIRNFLSRIRKYLDGNAGALEIR